MPFDLHNATNTFQRIIYEILHGRNFVFTYIDGLMLTSSREEEHAFHLK